MTLPASGAISLTQVMAEIRTRNPGRAYPISLGDSDVLALAGVPGPANSLSNLYGKTASGGTMVVSSVDGYGSANSTTSGGTVACSPAVGVTGGSGSYTYAWSATSNPGSATLSNATSSTCSTSKTFAKQSTGALVITLQCVVTEVGGTGQVVTKTGITGNLDWSGTA